MFSAVPVSEAEAVLLVVGMLAVAPATYFVMRNRRHRMLITAAVWVVMLAGVMLVPLVNVGGSMSCGPNLGANHSYGCVTSTNYGSVSFAYFCMGAQITNLQYSDNSTSWEDYSPVSGCLFA